VSLELNEEKASTEASYASETGPIGGEVFSGTAAEAFAAGRLEDAERLCKETLAALGDQTHALHLLLQIHKAQNRTKDAEEVARRCLKKSADDIVAMNELALLLLAQSKLRDAEVHARNAVRVGPRLPQAHNLMGMVMTEANRPVVGEYHYRRVLALSGQRDPVLLANLAWNLKSQGKMEESRALYKEVTDSVPGLAQAWIGWARMEEADRNFEVAADLLARVEKMAPGNIAVLRIRATVLARTGKNEESLALLETLGRVNRDALLEKGRLLDKMGRHAEAWEAWTEAKAQTRKATGDSYRGEMAAKLVKTLRSFFTASRIELLPRATMREGAAQPIFILGFPRSGTTLLEQTLSSHSHIAAGDEIQLVHQLAGLLPRMFESPLPYPEALSELWMGDRRTGLDHLRDYYLQNVADLGILADGKRIFTDKMPLNETHLALIALMFPQAPLLQLRRHPLDVMISVFSNHMTHGYFCSYELESAARHYALIDGLVAHYRAQMELNYAEVRYEDLVTGQEATVRRVLGLAGVDFEPACLSFHENRRYARTASYAQVTEALYDRSIGRWEKYRSYLEPIMPILAPVIERHGYSV
jgi:tetratricopeptide (TPR) repeat protein